MRCYECSQAGTAKEAIGICQHCSAGLCADHVYVEADPLTTLYAVFQARVLPKKARLLFCKTCQEALQQPLRKTA
jgi:hypothetical protein